MIHSPRAIVFDMDGLMFDCERTECAVWQAATARYGYLCTDALHRSLIERRVPRRE
jgi:beta-phosphoglucomutase-like phosphatase (HAD superfamily)